LSWPGSTKVVRRPYSGWDFVTVPCRWDVIHMFTACEFIKIGNNLGDYPDLNFLCMLLVIATDHLTQTKPTTDIFTQIHHDRFIAFATKTETELQPIPTRTELNASNACTFRSTRIDCAQAVRDRRELLEALGRG
jgi:hypothetical protein